MHEGVVQLDPLLEAGDDAAVAVQPSECPLHDPPPFVPPQPPAITGRGTFPPATVRSDEGEPAVGQLLPQRVGVVPPVGDEWQTPAQPHSHRDARHRCRPDHRLRYAGRVRGHPERDARAVHDECHLHADAATGAADARPPWRSSANVASKNNSDGSKRPTAASSSTTMRCTVAHTPARVQSRCRRQQVTPDGKQGGKWFHRTALRSWYTIPAKHALSSAQGRPPRGC